MIQILSKIRIHSNKLLLIGNRLDGSYAVELVSMSCKVISTGSSNSRLINWDNSSIGMSYKTSIRSISSSISNRTCSGIYSTIDSLGSKMISTGSSNSRLINGNKSSIRVGNKLSVQVEGTSITSISNSNWGS